MALFSSASRQIRLLIGADSDQLNRELGKAESRLKRFGRNVSSIQGGTALSGKGGLAGSAALLRGGGVALAAGLATQKAVEFTNAASALNEQLSKSGVIFGESAGDIEAWSKSLASSFGVAQTQAVEAAATFGAIFKSAGRTESDAARLSKSVVELAADLASFNDTTVDDALQALRSGLSGEIEPLRRFNVFLTEAAVQQQALADSGKTSAKQLTQGEKIFARYELIMKQTTAAQGDNERTAGSLANQQRRLQAQVSNLEVSIGKGLLPVMTRFVTTANEMIEAGGHIGGVLQAADQKSSGFLGGALKNLGKVSVLISPAGPIVAGTKVVNILFGETEKHLEDINALAATFASTISGINLNPLKVPSLTTRPEKPEKPGVTDRTPPAFGQPGFKPSVQGTPLTQLPNRLVEQELDARLTGNRLTLKGVLAKEAQVIQEALKDVRLKPGEIVALKQSLLGVTQEIQSIDDQIIQDAKDKRAAAQDARKKMADAKKKAVDALKKQAQAFQDQADDIKSAVLSAFDSRRAKVENQRALEDASKALKLARQIGGPEGIKLALRDLQDARFAVQRQRIEDTQFRVTGGPRGPVNTLTVGNVVININSNQPAEDIAKQVQKALLREASKSSGQSRGRRPGTNPIGL